jgi:hypothetical protein
MVTRRLAKGSRLTIALLVNKNPFEVINYGSGKDVYDETWSRREEPRVRDPGLSLAPYKALRSADGSESR